MRIEWFGSCRASVLTFAYGNEHYCSDSASLYEYRKGVRVVLEYPVF
jgi:hypothetical protein